MSLIKFYVRDTNGNVVRFGTCSKDTLKLQAKTELGETSYEGDTPRIPDAPIWDNTYIYQRNRAYPPISEQLDTIYHKGIDVWKAEIAAIKAKYPKV